MWVAIIPRSKFLVEFAELGDMHFVVPDTPELFDYYAQSDKFKMIDNGAYELGKPISDEQLVRLAYQMDVDEVIAPDVLNDAQQTLMRTRHFLETQTLRGLRVCVVPQGRTISEWIECYKRMCRLPVQTIAIPIWIQKRFRARPLVVKRLLKEGIFEKSLDHHLLGLDNISELYEYPKGVIRSVDTSLPLSLAYHRRVRAGKHTRLPTTARFDEYQRQLARMLIDKLKRIAARR